MESTAMMRRKNTSRRVQTFSSVSIRSDEIAATDMALSRDGSRDCVSVMAALVVRDIYCHSCMVTLGPSARQNQSGKPCSPAVAAGLGSGGERREKGQDWKHSKPACRVS